MSGLSFFEQNGCETNFAPSVPQPLVRLNGYAVSKWNWSCPIGQV